MTRSSRFRLVVLAVAVTVAVLGVWRGSGPPEADRGRQVQEIASGLRCPTCQSTSVAGSPSRMAKGMRGIIEQQLADGRSPDEVRAWFVDRYGEWILLEPSSEGPGLVLWVAPGLVVLAAGGWVLRQSLVRRRAAARGAATGGPGASPTASGRPRGQVMATPGTAAVGWTVGGMLVSVVVTGWLGGSLQPRSQLEGQPAAPAEAPTAGAPTAGLAGSPALSSLAELRRRVAEDPQDPALRTAYGDALDLRGRTGQAAQQYERARALRPGDPAVAVRLAFAAARSGDQPRSRRLLGEVLGRYPDHPDALLLLGTLDLEVGRPRGEALLRRFLVVAPDNPAAQHVRAVLNSERDPR